MKIRKAEKEDMMFLFSLRNETVVRKSAFDTDPVDLRTHRQWFNRKLTGEDTIILIAENDGDKIGQIRFDIDSKIDTAEVDIAVIQKYRGKGLGTKFLKMACDYAFEKLHMKKIVAYIKFENEISVKSFSKAGFKNCGFANYKGHKCVKMALEKEQW